LNMALHLEHPAAGRNGHLRKGEHSRAERPESKKGRGAPRIGREEMDHAAIEDAVRAVLAAVGEDPSRDGLLGTPDRVARMYGELLEGYTKDLTKVINGAMFDVDYDDGEMVAVAEIPYTSLCEHHMLPFVGTAHVAYVPRDRVVGLSKIPRVVDMFARRLQVQERMTHQVADALETALDPKGIMVVVEGQHSCASLRGVKKHGVNMVTTARRGLFREDRALVEDFYRLIRK
jgi:GTP cyclohydrolase I